ncbi:tetratricopeptide repeat protein [Xanthomonas sp. NCPPB 2632]|uniref:tetratricopeptide repeat protein n=1 Tax=Xanthomonas sp. NCPPB 2632 TaxID=3240912 RepID=UPI003513EF9B
MSIRRLLPFACMLLLTAATWLAYRPGLEGGFLFDDFANLPSLGETGPVEDWATFARYATSGHADPTGRPLSVISFLIDARDWPADPYPFKRTNLILHLLNGLLLFTLLIRLGKVASRDARWNLTPQKTGFAALIGAGSWLLHPFFVSTTLYIVQREAMLPATFAFMGLLGWVHGWELMQRGISRLGSSIAMASLAAFTLLGVLAKANGVLLPLFILVIEHTLLRRTVLHNNGRPTQPYRVAIAACWMCFLLIAIGLAYAFSQGVRHGLGNRPWTMIERLLTEARIVIDYIRSLWMPRPYTAGLFNDATVVSTSLLHPWTTLPALAFIVVVTAAAFHFRRVTPAWSMAWGFFVTGHLLESTSIPLELYFEHRNYLPAAFMFWPLGLWLSGATLRLRPRIDDNPRSFPSLAVRIALATVILSTLFVMTRSNAIVWGDTSQQATLWAALNPASPRAQVLAAQEEVGRGDPAAALSRLEPMLARHPEEVQLAINLIAARCAVGGVRPTDIAAAANSLGTAPDPGTLIVSWYDRILPVVESGACPGLDAEALVKIASSGLTNPRLAAGRRQDLEHVIGAVRLAQGRGEEALTHYNLALAYEPRESIALRQAAELGSAGFSTLGMQHLTTYDALTPASTPPAIDMTSLHAWVLKRQRYWSVERERLEESLRADIKSHP